jgi:hypothetical protein
MPNVLRDTALANPVTFALAATGGGTRYDVGPGQTYTEFDTVPWGTLTAGSVVNIHYRAAPYVAKFGLRAQGTATDRVVINGVTDSAGNRPVMNANGATTASGSANVFSATPAYGELLGAVVIKQAPTDTYSTYWPGYIDIQNLSIQGAANGNPWTDKFGSAQVYGASAGVYILHGHDIRILNCRITDNGFGVFTQEAKDTTGNWYCRDITVSGCQVEGNGVSGSYLEHNFYVQAVRPVITGNYIGQTRTGSLGSSYKSRSSGEVFAYNTVVASARAMDFVHAEGQSGPIDQDAQYGETWCYGNLILNDITGTGRGAGVALHFGCDQSMEDGAIGTPTLTDVDLAPGGTQRLAKRNLFFYNNTYVTRVMLAQSYRTHLFDISLSGTVLSPRTTVWEWDNVYHCEGDSNFMWVEYAGALRFMGGSKVFSTAAIDSAHANADPAKYALVGTVPSGSVPVGFTSVANNDYMPVVGAAIDGAAVATPSALPSTWVARTVDYMPNGVGGGGLYARSALADVGAFDNLAGAPAPTPSPPPSGASMIILQKSDLSTASFANSNSLGAGGITVRVDAGSTVKAAIDAAVAAVSAAPAATDTVAGVSALAVVTNFPANIANNVEVTTGAYVSAAISAATGPSATANSWLVAWSGDPVNLMHSAITYDANGAITTAAVQWPDGGSGTYTATTQSTAFPGSTDAYTVTYTGAGTGHPWAGVTKTVTQALVTRNAAGRVIVRPLRTVA